MDGCKLPDTYARPKDPAPSPRRIARKTTALYGSVRELLPGQILVTLRKTLPRCKCTSKTSVIVLPLLGGLALLRRVVAVVPPERPRTSKSFRQDGKEARGDERSLMKTFDSDVLSLLGDFVVVEGGQVPRGTEIIAKNEVYLRCVDGRKILLVFWGAFLRLKATKPSTPIWFPNSASLVLTGPPADGRPRP